nr:MAG TPA: hypothetical protein [Caudoviricetes sp.]DAL74781.1 MAG TPA: hypothetical protein [Caudoviricetes sp.]
MQTTGTTLPAYSHRPVMATDFTGFSIKSPPLRPYDTTGQKGGQQKTPPPVGEHRRGLQT